MHVLLTGAAGFVGRVALELLNERHQVTAFDIQNVESTSCYDGGVVEYITDNGASRFDILNIKSCYLMLFV